MVFPRIKALYLSKKLRHYLGQKLVQRQKDRKVDRCKHVVAEAMQESKTLQSFKFPR